MEENVLNQRSITDIPTNTLFNSTQTFLSNSTLSDDMSIQQAGFWRIQDYLEVAAIFVVCFVLSMLFYAGRGLIRKVWPGFLHFEPFPIDKYMIEEQEQDVEQFAFQDEQGNTSL